MDCIAAVPQAETDILATTGSDRSIALYDLRSGKAIRKLIMQTRTNSVAWNPMEAFNFVAASEDCNLYSYDMRKLGAATCVHQVLVSIAQAFDSFSLHVCVLAPLAKQAGRRHRMLQVCAAVALGI